MTNKFAGVSSCVCDKCGRKVERNNDAVLIEAYGFNEPMGILFNQSRHFLPVVENGKIVCEGSPSRAQYIEGQPRDSRGYGYHPEYEEKWRNGYVQVQNPE